MEHDGPNTDASLVTLEGEGQCVCMCVHLCVCVRRAWGWGGGGRLQPCSKAICLGQKVPLSFTDGWACTPISGGERGAKGTQRRRRHLCVCLTNKLLLWSMYGLDLFYTECNLRSITDKNTSWSKSNAGSGEKSYWGKQNPMTPLKELAFSTPWGKKWQSKRDRKRKLDKK